MKSNVAAVVYGRFVEVLVGARRLLSDQIVAQFARKNLTQLHQPLHAATDITQRAFSAGEIRIVQTDVRCVELIWQRENQRRRQVHVRLAMGRTLVVMASAFRRVDAIVGGYYGSGLA